MVKEYRVLRGGLSVRPAPHPSPSDPSNPSGQNVEAQHYAIFVPSLKFTKRGFFLCLFAACQQFVRKVRSPVFRRRRLSGIVVNLKVKCNPTGLARSQIPLGRRHSPVARRVGIAACRRTEVFPQPPKGGTPDVRIGSWMVGEEAGSESAGSFYA